jgi:hypothetical protein
MPDSVIERRGVRLKDVLAACTAHPRFRDRFANARPMGSVEGGGLPLSSKPRPMDGDSGAG